MTHIPFIQRIGERSVYRCDFCGTEESYADATDVAAFARFRTEFVQKHSQCKTPTVKPTNPPGQKEKTPMVKERKKASCSHCGETGHNAKTCEKKGLDRLEHGAPTRATLRKNRGGAPHRGSEARRGRAQDAGGRTRFAGERDHHPHRALDRVRDDRGRRDRDPRPGGRP